MIRSDQSIFRKLLSRCESPGNFFRVRQVAFKCPSLFLPPPEKKLRLRFQEDPIVT